jgi:hypothetical protein
MSMATELDSLLPEVKMRAPLPLGEVDEVFTDFIAEVGPMPHKDYLAFMRAHNGCDGPVGKEGVISIWPLEDVVSGTEGYNVEEFAPGLLLFAGDGGGTGYAFDRQDPRWPVVEVELVSISRDEMKFVAPTFSEFIRKLANDEV